MSARPVLLLRDGTGGGSVVAVHLIEWDEELQVRPVCEAVAVEGGDGERGGEDGRADMEA